MKGKCILVWRWENAPQDYKNLSPHGGDEDWVAFVPKGMIQPMWMESGTSFGCCDVSEHVLPAGRIYIGAHA